MARELMFPASCSQAATIVNQLLYLACAIQWLLENGPLAGLRSMACGCEKIARNRSEMVELLGHLHLCHLTNLPEDRGNRLRAPKQPDPLRTIAGRSGNQRGSTSISTKPLPAWQYPPSSSHSVVSRVSIQSPSRPTLRPTGGHRSLSGRATGMLSRFSKITPIVTDRRFNAITASTINSVCQDERPTCRP
jgi:hypothetical protein